MQGGLFKICLCGCPEVGKVQLLVRARERRQQCSELVFMKQVAKIRDREQKDQRHESWGMGQRVVYTCAGQVKI